MSSLILNQGIWENCRNEWKINLELSCCKNRQKKVPSKKLAWGTGRLNLNDTKLIHSCSFRTNLVSFRTFRRPLFPKPISWLRLFYRFLQQHGSSRAIQNWLWIFSLFSAKKNQKRDFINKILCNFLVRTLQCF